VLACTVLATSFAAAAQIPAPKRPASAPKPAATEPDTPEESEEPPAAENQPRRLILKDGSYQPTVRWEVRGDRVRYLSAERYQWEEVPNEMVDWDATERYRTQRATPAQPSPEMRAVIEAEKEEQRKEKEELDASNPEVAPGLRLPDGGGVYLLDVYRGEPQLIELVQNGSKVDRATKKNVLRAVINPLAKNKKTIELPGMRARIQAHVPDPVVYLNIDQDNDPATGLAAPDASQRFQIVRVEPHLKKKSRIVGTIEFAIYSGAAQKHDVIETSVAAVGEHWVKVSPTTNLTPGEYAVVEILGKDVNLYVWDFGITPNAPQNPANWTPDPPKETESGLKEILKLGRKK